MPISGRALLVSLLGLAGVLMPYAVGCSSGDSCEQTADCSNGNVCAQIPRDGLNCHLGKGFSPSCPRSCERPCGADGGCPADEVCKNELTIDAIDADYEYVDGHYVDVCEKP